MPFDAFRFSQALSTRRFGREFQHFASLDSTSAYVKRLARQEAAPETCLLVVADSQTGGYGQRGRSWESMEGQGLYFTLLLPALNTPLVTLMVGVALIEALRGLTGSEELGLKWVNDLVLRRQKLGGVLVEACHQRWMAVGVGVNLQAVPEVQGIGLNALGGPFERELVLATLMNSLERWHERLMAGDGRAVREAWEGYSVTLGQEVRIETGHQELRGLAEGIDDTGALLLRTFEGPIIPVNSGTVRRLDGAYC